MTIHARLRRNVSRTVGVIAAAADSVPAPAPGAPAEARVAVIRGPRRPWPRERPSRASCGCELALEAGQRVVVLAGARSAEVPHRVEVGGGGSQGVGVRRERGGRGIRDAACGGAGVHAHEVAVDDAAHDRPVPLLDGQRPVARPPRRRPRRGGALAGPGGPGRRRAVRRPGAVAAVAGRPNTRRPTTTSTTTTTSTSSARSGPGMPEAPSKSPTNQSRIDCMARSNALGSALTYSGLESSSCSHRCASGASGSSGALEQGVQDVQDHVAGRSLPAGADAAVAVDASAGTRYGSPTGCPASRCSTNRSSSRSRPSLRMRRSM